MPKVSRIRKKRPGAAAQFNHAMVYVTNLSLALHFYSDLLGMEVIEQDGTGYARLRSTTIQTTLALHYVEGVTEVPDERIRLYFETEQLDELYAAMKAAGVRVLQPPELMPWGWRHAYLLDPDGHEVSLYWADGKRFQRTMP